jgi:hypothetical protein
MTEPVAIVRALELQAAACTALGSRFSATLLERAAADAAANGSVAGLFSPWDRVDVRSLIASAVALRWLGALHELALSGEAPGLSATYPGKDRAGDAEKAWTEILDATRDHVPRLAAFMAHEPQTNEVRRSACLLPGFLKIAEITGLPLRTLELGASAGLNQLWYQYHYELGPSAQWGDPNAYVRLETDWRGPPPPLGAAIKVIDRRACDRKPVDLADPVARQRLKAYVWPDQIDRLDRLETAIAVATDTGVHVEEEDAVSWTLRHASPIPDAVTVVFHSVFIQYMPSESQAALVETINRHGAQATPTAPLAWLRMEPPANNPAAMELRLTLWPGGEERILAMTHPHGAWVEWLGA